MLMLDSSAQRLGTACPLSGQDSTKSLLALHSLCLPLWRNVLLFSRTKSNYADLRLLRSYENIATNHEAPEAFAGLTSSQLRT
jgi:hypothetical protein